VPFLDNEYTVYGEVTEGIEIVDKIQKVKTNSSDRPLENIIIESMQII
jgi:peptidylprolyl isomerase/peptidyl-prolyl cis-trans isomerase B (cyclophilin B)